MQPYGIDYGAVTYEGPMTEHGDAAAILTARIAELERDAVQWVRNNAIVQRRVESLERQLAEARDKWAEWKSVAAVNWDKQEQQRARADDYRSLLVRYIQHVGECEGTYFLSDGYRPLPEWAWAFTDAEWEHLWSLAQEGETFTQAEGISPEPQSP